MLKLSRLIALIVALASATLFVPAALAEDGGPKPLPRANWDIVAGADAGASSFVGTFDLGTPVGTFLAYPTGFSGGVRVAVGDVNGDGSSNIITGSGVGAAHVKIFDGLTGAEVRSFLPYDGFTGGVFVAAGDISGDGVDDIITGAGAGGGPHVKVFDGATNAPLGAFFAYDASFSGGVHVAAGDVTGDGRADVITGSGVGASHVKVFDGLTGLEARSFLAYPGFTGGVFVAAGDINSDGVDDIITGAGAGGGPHVKVFDGANNTLLHSFFAYAGSFTGGVRVATGDVNADGQVDIITGAGPGGGPHVKVFDALTNSEIDSFFAFPSFTGGVYVAGVPSAPTAPPPPPVTIDSILDAVDDAIADGTMVGAGRSPKSAAAHLKAWTNHLKGLEVVLERENAKASCALLRNRLQRIDGDASPPDFVEGPAASVIAAMFADLQRQLACS